jgi:hypothetical protein
MFRYLEAANEFGALAARTLVSEAARRIGAGVDSGPASRRHIDDRAALTYMREVLDELVG